MTLDIHVPAGTTGHDRLSVDISAADAGWDSSGLRVAVLAAGESVRLETGGTELLVLPLAGGCRIEAGDRSYDLAGRDSVFTQITDYLYVPRNTVCTVTSEGGGRFALPSAVAGAPLRPRAGRSNHPRRRGLLPTGQQLRSQQRCGDLPPACHRGADPGGQLVVLPGS